MAHSETAVKLIVSGHVQGVGFRWWSTAQARELELVGYARNLDDGTVEILAQGSRPAVEALQERLNQDASVYGRPGEVTGVSVSAQPVEAGLSGFGER